jgi:hypothetical protein
MELTSSPALRGDGPLLSRSLGAAPPHESAALAERVLANTGVERIVTAHPPTRAGRIVVRDDGVVLRLDTGARAAAAPGLGILVIDERGARVLDASGALRAPGPERREGGLLFSGGEKASRCEIERFLRKARVVGSENIGKGITGALRLELELRSVERRAAFKTVDREMQRLVRLRDSIEYAFADKYVFEVAAYRLDRLLGLGLVPPTVLREHEDEEGSAQLWVEGAMSRSAFAAEHPAPRDPEWIDKQVNAMHVFDVLIFNPDRNPGNVLVTPGDERLHLIDHSRAFSLRSGRPPGLEDTFFWLSPELEARLTVLDDGTLRGRLGELLSRARRRAILERRDEILADWRARVSRKK